MNDAPIKPSLISVISLRSTAEDAVTKLLLALEAETGCKVSVVDVERDFSAERNGVIKKVNLTVRLP